MKIVCVGDCGIDLYQPSGERRVGGITANFARHARDLFPSEDSVQIVSCVGNDEGGDVVLGVLRNTAIDCDIERLDGMTPTQWIEVQPDGERFFTRYDPGVLAAFSFDDDRRKIIGDSDLLVAPVYLQIVGVFDSLMSIETNGLVAIDFADFLEHPDYELLKRHLDPIDIGFFGLRPDENLEPLQAIAKEAGKLFIVTLGEAGSVALSAGDRIDCPADVVASVVDTTGAGDAFAAGFLSQFCHGGDVASSMACGASVAARVVSQHGAY